LPTQPRNLAISVLAEREVSEETPTSIIIPTLNEAQGIGMTIREIIRSLDDPEIIVIDGNSVDGTSQIAASLGAKVVRQQGLGKGRAVTQALQHKDKNTKYLVLIDGDYTYPAKYIPKMINILEEKQDVGMVTGERFSNPGRMELPTHVKKLITDPYYFGNQALKLAHQIFNRVKMKDPLTGLRVIRCSHIEDFQPKAKSFDLEVEINEHMKRKGTKTLEIPIKYRQRLGEKKLCTIDGFRILMRIVIMALEGSSLRLKNF